MAKTTQVTFQCDWCMKMLGANSETIHAMLPPNWYRIAIQEADTSKNTDYGDMCHECFHKKLKRK